LYETSLTRIVSLQFTQRFWDSSSGMYDRVTPWAIDPISRKGLVMERMAFVEVVFTQTDGAEPVPPPQDHPFSTLH
jgi:hypothetical protein